MGLFTKNEDAKARRTQEREEKQKKAKAVPPPYVHTPTHALRDSLLSVPHAHDGTDKQRLKQAHQERLEKEAAALAAGSDTSVTNIPAKYWQGQPLPAQFTAPTPAKLRKLALSGPSLQGKEIELPVTSKAPPQTPTDEGYASGHNRNSTGKPSREPADSAEGPFREPKTKQSQQDQAAEAGREAELECLRRRVRELEAKQRGTQDEQSPFGHPSVRTKPSEQNDSSPKTIAGAAPVSVRNFSRKSGFESRTSSSDALKSPCSGVSNMVDEFTPPTSMSIVNGIQGGGGVDRYDGTNHLPRAAARTEEERAKLPPATGPQQRPPPTEKHEPCYASLDEFSHNVDPASAAKYPSNSRRRRSTRVPQRPGTVSVKSNATVVGSSPPINRRDLMETPSHKHMADFDFGFAAATTPNTLRPNHTSSWQWI